MRIGVIDFSWYHLPVEKRLKRIADLGFEGVQLAVTSTELGFNLKNGADAWFDKRYRPVTRSFPKGDLKRILKQNGLTVTMLGPHYVLGEHFTPKEASTGVFPSMAAKKERIADIKRMIDYAVDIDAGFVELFSGGNPNKPEHWPQLVEMVKEVADHAEKNGIILTFENMGAWQMPVCDEYSLIRLIRDVGSKAVRVTFDPKNLEQSRYQADIPRAVRALRGLIVRSHNGDAIYGAGHVAPIGTGTINYPEYLVALRDVGYDDWLSLEAMFEEKQYLESRKYIEDIIRLLITPKWPAGAQG